MNKIIVFTLLLVGLVGMIGTAAAEGSFAYGIIYTTDDVEVEDALVKAYDINDTELSNSLGEYTTGEDGKYSINLGTYNGDSVVLTAEKGNMYGEYTVAKEVWASFNMYIQDITIDVPEFPTIALPVAAMLGLMFIISSRKKKE